MTSLRKKLEEIDKCPGTSKAVTRSVANQAKSWEDDSVSDYEPAILPCGVEARANAIKDGQGSSGAITHAEGADAEDGENGVPEVAGILPAEKGPNEGKGVEKPVGSGTEKQANKGTAYKIASGIEPMVHKEDGTKKKNGAIQEATTGVVFQSRFEQPGRHGLKENHTQENCLVKIGISNDRCH